MCNSKRPYSDKIHLSILYLFKNIAGNTFINVGSIIDEKYGNRCFMYLLPVFVFFENSFASV